MVSNPSGKHPELVSGRARDSWSTVGRAALPGPRFVAADCWPLGPVAPLGLKPRMLLIHYAALKVPLFHGDKCV
jgi:hypothetical protein